ncbi:tyrosine-type recombinase/integrase [Trinickia acidisoli]|uniref:tyrosine-type recombinase/integrase n=1 Tax=Trinickia acidisoli TaxID=2767482 RepID=UPI001A8FCC28|nr:site-specific integrase [Trinickia acidisoli]
MLSISKRIKKNGQTQWQATVRVEGQKSVSRTFQTWDQAREFGAGLERELLALGAKAPEAELPPDLLNEDIGEIVAAFANSPRARPRHRGFAPTVVKHVSGRKVSDVRPRWVREYIERLRELPSKRRTIYSWSSISSHLILISLAIRWRAEELDVAAPPFPRFMQHFPDDHDPARERRLAPEEERALLGSLCRMRNAEGRLFCLLILLAIETAARLQELVLADWSEFHFRTVRGKERGWWLIPKEHAKTKKARLVPLTARARKILRAMRCLQPNLDKPVFVGLGTPGRVSDRFREHAKRAGLVDFRFHDLRHEGITRMVLRTPHAPYKVMRAAGHSSMDMLNRYANLLPDDLFDLVD